MLNYRVNLKKKNLLAVVNVRTKETVNMYNCLFQTTFAHKMALLKWDSFWCIIKFTKQSEEEKTN